MRMVVEHAMNISDVEIVSLYFMRALLNHGKTIVKNIVIINDFIKHELLVLTGFFSLYLYCA